MGFCRLIMAILIIIIIIQKPAWKRGLLLFNMAGVIVSLRDGIILRGVSPLELPTKGEAVGGYAP